MLFRPHYELLDYCDSNDAIDLVFRGGESPSGYYPSTPPQHHKGRPRKRKLAAEGDACGDIPVTMRMAAATLGKRENLIHINCKSCACLFTFSI